MKNQWTLFSRDPRNPQHGEGSTVHETEAGFNLACHTAVRNGCMDLRAILPDGRMINDAAVREVAKRTTV